MQSKLNLSGEEIIIKAIIELKKNKNSKDL